jgi:hypothetical protein
LWHVLAGCFVGALVGSVLNFLISIQSVRLIQALDDLIAITVAYRSTPKAG